MIRVDNGPVAGQIDDAGPIPANSDHCREWDSDKAAASQNRLVDPQIWFEFHLTTAGIVCIGTKDHLSNTTLRRYRNLLKNVPELRSQLADRRSGIEEGGSLSLTISDVDDGEYPTWREIAAAEEIRGQRVNAYTFNEDDGATFEFRAEIKGYRFQPGLFLVDLQYRNEDILSTPVPRHVVTTDLAHESAVDLGLTYPIALGKCRNVPLRHIRNDTANDYYDYSPGYGTLDSVWSDAVSNIGVKRNENLANSTEYTWYDGSQSSPYPGKAFLRFAREQKDDSEGFFHLTADINGLELGTGAVCRNPIRQLRYLLADTSFGLGETINENSFDRAEAAIEAIGDIYSDGVIVDQRSLRNYIDKLLFISRARLWRNTKGEWCVHVDRLEGISGEYTDGIDCEVQEVSVPSTSESIANIICRYAQDRTNDDRAYYEMILAVSSCGTDKILDDEMIFVAETATAKKVMSFYRNTLVWDDVSIVKSRETLRVKLGAEGKRHEKGQILTINPNPDPTVFRMFGDSAMNIKIESIRKTPGGYTVEGYRHDSGVYDDETISSPTAVAQTSSGYGVVIGQPWYTVSPFYGLGKYQTIQAALNALPDAGGRLALLKGEHVQTDGITVPNKDLYVEGENLDQVIVKNKAGSHLFVLSDCTKKFEFQRFKIASQNVAAFSRMFSITGTAAANNTAEVQVRNVNMTLKDLNTYASAYNDGDFGVYAETGQGYVRISDNCYFNNAPTQVFVKDYSRTGGRRILDVVGSSFCNPTYGAVLVSGGSEWCVTGCVVENFWQNAIDGINTPGRAMVTNNSCVSKNDALTGGKCLGAIWLRGNRAIATGNIIFIQTSREDMAVITGIEALLGTYIKIDSNQITIISSSDINPYGILDTASDSGTISSNTIDIDADDATYNHYGIQSSGSFLAINANVIDMYNNNAKDLGLYLGCVYAVGRANMTYRCGTGITDVGVGNDVDGLDA